MASSMKGFEHLEIQLEEIISATNNFNEENVIGHGGFGKVYKVELFHSNSKRKSMVALKRLDRRHGQGDAEFYKEVRMLSCYRHENIISLLGFSRGQDEMILVYEYASRGSLDVHLKDVNLTWTQRLKICLDAAKGLCYLHDPRETYQRLIHCDIKSANILLDDNFNAKIADFGLSKIGPANQQNSILVTEASGTPGYYDPVYMETYTLTKESDVYSFGVVLFEVLCGKLCVEYSRGKLKVFHVPMWKQSYEKKQLSGIVFQGLTEQMNPDSLETFADIAYKCLKRFREERPVMSLVVEKLQESLAIQELHDLKPPKEYEEIVNAAVPPLNYKSLDELKVLLTKGFHVNEGKTLFCLNEKGEHIERIFIEACLNPNIAGKVKYRDDRVDSRFPGRRCYEYRHKFIARVRAEYLSPHISYTVNLVFRYRWQSHDNSYNPLRYKVDGEDETKVLIIYPTHMREDGWFFTPLYQFTSQQTTVDLRFEFEYRWTRLLVAGIEFQPSEEKEELQEDQDVVHVASQPLWYTSLDELKQILSKGVHLNGYKTWFSLNKKGEHCHMISMKDCLIPNEDFPSRYESDCWSRFPAGLYQTNNKGFKTHVKTQLLSPLITYSVNLVFRSSSNDGQAYVDLKYRLSGESTTFTVYLAKKTSWFFYMAELYQFTSEGSTVDLEIMFEDCQTNIGVEGILFQPLEIAKSDSGLSKNTEKKAKKTERKAKSLYSTLGKIFEFNKDTPQEWSYLDKNEKKCVMLSARKACFTVEGHFTWRFLPDSRFGEVFVVTAGDKFELVYEIKPELLPAKTRYASYFVYKLPSHRSKFKVPLEVSNKRGENYYKHMYSYLVSPPNTPVIGQMSDENSYNPLNRHKLSSLPRQRSDGWMEVKAWEFINWHSSTVLMHLKLEHPAKKDLSGLIIHGIELRPI